MTELSSFISSVGFPIVVAIAMFYQNNTLSSNYQKLTEQVQAKLESNTETLTRLIEKLDQDDVLKEKLTQKLDQTIIAKEKGDTK